MLPLVSNSLINIIQLLHWYPAKECRTLKSWAFPQKTNGLEHAADGGDLSATLFYIENKEIKM